MSLKNGTLLTWASPSELHLKSFTDTNSYSQNKHTNQKKEVLTVAAVFIHCFYINTQTVLAAVKPVRKINK